MQLNIRKTKNSLIKMDRRLKQIFSKEDTQMANNHIKRCLFLGRKVMTNLDSILKSRDITLPTKVHLVKAMVFLFLFFFNLFIFLNFILFLNFTKLY